MMMKITSNYHWRKFITGMDLTNIEKEDFDYLDDIESEFFIRYYNQPYWIGDFMKHEIYNWHGQYNLTVFSSLVIRISNCGSLYQIGLLTS